MQNFPQVPRFLCVKEPLLSSDRDAIVQTKSDQDGQTRILLRRYWENPIAVMETIIYCARILFIFFIVLGEMQLKMFILIHVLETLKKSFLLHALQQALMHSQNNKRLQTPRLVSTCKKLEFLLVVYVHGLISFLTRTPLVRHTYSRVCVVCGMEIFSDYRVHPTTLTFTVSPLPHKIYFPLYRPHFLFFSHYHPHLTKYSVFFSL